MKALDPTGKPFMLPGPSRPASAQPITSGFIGGNRLQATAFQTSTDDTVLSEAPTPTVDPTRWAFGTITQSWTLTTAYQDFLAITQSDSPRVFLSIRNDISSTGYLLIAFGTTANDSTSLFALPIGGIIFLDTVVPQDDIHIACTVAPTGAIIGYGYYHLAKLRKKK